MELALRELGIDARPVKARKAAHVGRLDFESDLAQEGRLQVGKDERDSWKGVQREEGPRGVLRSVQLAER